MKIKLLSQNYINELKVAVNNGNIGHYSNNINNYDDKFVRGFTVINLPEDIQLSTSRTDFENSKILFEAIPTLSRVQAADERLWTTLAHINFGEYMKNRWPVKKAEDALSHYFFNPGNLKSYYRHGIGRLWWFAYLTVDDNRTDKYELTNVLFKDQDIALNILERALGRSKNILHAYLDNIKENKLDRNAARVSAKYLNFYGGVNLLDSHDLLEVKKILSQ
jgi:hypothetical protein